MLQFSLYGCAIELNGTDERNQNSMSNQLGRNKLSNYTAEYSKIKMFQQLEHMWYMVLTANTSYYEKLNSKELSIYCIRMHVYHPKITT